MASAELEKARRGREDAEKRLAAKIVELEKLENRRNELKKRDPKSEEIEEKVKRELLALSAEIKQANERVHALEGLVESLSRKARRLARRLRKPKVINLNLPGTGSAMGQIHGSIGHYTAGVEAEDDEQAIRLWRAVHEQHRNQGWAMIGYHIGLGPDGNVYLLRPLRFSGAHTLGFNTGYVGFSVHGSTGDTWTRPQLRAFRFALKKFNLKGKPVWGHNDKNATACPGSFKRGYVTKGEQA